MLDENIATLWEAIAQTIPQRLAVACGETELTWAQFEDRAARLANALSNNGIGEKGKVGLMLFNGHQYLEAQFAAMKCRAIPLNINTRYTGEELASILMDGDVRTLIYDASLRDRVSIARNGATQLTTLIEVDPTMSGGPALDFETLIANTTPADPIERSGSDLWFLYTGGTTGYPKAVMYEHKTLLRGAASALSKLGESVPRDLEEATAMIARLAEGDRAQRLLPASPLIHGAATVSAIRVLSLGGLVVTTPPKSFSAQAVWEAVARHRVRMLTIVGDAFSRPLAETLVRLRRTGNDIDVSSLKLIVSSGALWSESSKLELLDLLDIELLDAIGSSETTTFLGWQQSSRSRPPAQASFRLGEDARVIDDSGQSVVPGSGIPGRLALGTDLPLGYYKDPEKTRATFQIIEGRRWVIPGDYARVEADGRIVLLGRGSQCINSAGEKVYPEEVEEVLIRHSAVADCVVVGVPDERWGQAVTAVIALNDPNDPPADVDLKQHCANHIAGYKIPKRFVFVDHIQRLATGKPDYSWAQNVVQKATVN